MTFHHPDDAYAALLARAAAVERKAAAERDGAAGVRPPDPRTGPRARS